MAEFQKTIPDVIREILRDALPSGMFKSDYYGDPLAVPSTLLPAFFVNKTKTDISSNTTGTDQMRWYITVTLILNKKDEWMKAPNEQVGKRRLEELAEGIDPTTGELSAYSVIGVLRKNFSLSQNADNQTVTIDYVFNNRGGNPKDPLITEEVNLNFIVERRLTVTNRS